MKKNLNGCVVIFCAFLAGIICYSFSGDAKSGKESQESLMPQIATESINCEALLEESKAAVSDPNVFSSEIEPRTGYEWDYARKKYEECLFLGSKSECFQWLYSEMILCLAIDGKFISDNQIRTLITGGAPEEQCRDIEAFCAPPDHQEPDTQTQYFLTQTCIQDLKIRCFGSR